MSDADLRHPCTRSDARSAAPSPSPFASRAHGQQAAGVAQRMPAAPGRRGHLMAGLLVAVLVTVVVARTATPAWAAPAACGATSRAADAAASELQPAVTAGDLAAQDASALLQRSRARCGALRVAVAIARATARTHPTRLGIHARVDDLQLITSDLVVGQAHLVAWRYEPLAQAQRIAAITRRHPERAAALLAPLVETAQPARGGALRWAGDPAGGPTDGRIQLAVTAALAGLPRGAGQAAARRSLAAFADHRIASAIVGGPLLGAVARTTVLARTAHTLGSSCSAGAARAMCAVLARRVSRAVTSPWPVVDGQPATAAVASGLQRSVARLAATAPEQHSYATSAATIRAHLAAGPSIHLVRLPVSAFYPVPADGVRDVATVSVRSDRPVRLALQVFAPAGTVADTVLANGGPGIVDIAWNGALAGRGIGSAPPGAYRWVLRARDPLGRRVVVPGVGSLTIARDTVPPVIHSTKVTIEGVGTRRTLHVSWAVDEALSPRIAVVLTIRGGAIRRTLGIPASALSGTGTVSTLLPAGTYRTFVRVTDGSGNAAAVASTAITAS